MIDFHLLRIGTRASDLRNVTGQLDPKSRDEFLRYYGPVPEAESMIDAPLAVIGALAQLDPGLSALPRWARTLIAEITNGVLDRKLDAALQIS